MTWDSSNRIIDDFLLQDLTGRRTSIEMYRATQMSLKRLVLVKIISLKGISETHHQIIEEFQAYVQAMVALEHMHLQPIYGYGVIDEDHIYVAGRIIAGSLYNLLQAGALPLERVLDLSLQITSALIYLDEKGFIHRSLSPHNVYISDDQNAYINDLELSPLLEVAKSLQELETLLDEPFYASVEQLQLMPLDIRSEIYTFGAILYHMVTGAAPFSDHENTFAKVLQRKLSDDVIAPRILNATISDELEKLILRLLRCNPNERPTEMGALHDDIKHLFDVVTSKPTDLSLLQKLKHLISRS